MAITAAEFETLVRRSLSCGVPTSVVAEVFALTEDVVRQAKREVLSEAYGTADQAEYLEWLQWRTLERCFAIIEKGSPADVTRIATTVLGRQIATAGKRTSEVQRDALEQLERRLSEMRQAPTAAAEPGRFVVRAPDLET